MKDYPVFIISHWRWRGRRGRNFKRLNGTWHY